jgi:hypothetical protein
MNAERITFTRKDVKVNHHYVVKSEHEKEMLVNEMKQKGFELTRVCPIQLVVRRNKYERKQRKT